MFTAVHQFVYISVCQFSKAWELVFCNNVCSFVDFVDFGYAYPNRLVDGWKTSGQVELKTEMVNLARRELNLNDNSASKSVRVLHFDIQILIGTNLRLLFVVGEHQECTLIAFKPLPYYEKPIKVTSLICNNVII